MKNFLAFVIISLIACGDLIAQTTIHSTFSGGNWDSASTWVEGIVPGSGSNVIIQGPVIQQSVSGYTIFTKYCNNLTITSTGSLRNGDYGGGTGTFHVNVSGNVINDGIVENGATDYLYITINGNFENNNIWRPHTTELSGTNDHNISLATGKSFGGKILVNGSNLNALSDLYFTCDFINEGTPARDHFRLNGNTLNLGNHSIELHKDCLINSGKLVGDFEIVGTFTVGWADGYNITDTLLFIGDISVTDTLCGNEYGGGYGIFSLKIIGSITNNGVIKDDYDSDNNPLNNDDLKIHITGDIYNYGAWKCNFTNLTGTSYQRIYQGTGKYFDSYLTFSNPSGDIRALTDITVTKDINLGGCILDMDDHTLNIQGWLSNGFLKRAYLNNGFLSNITSLDSIHIKGKVTLDNGNLFKDLLVVDDTLQNNVYGAGTYHFSLLAENIVNNGVIKDSDSDDRLIIRTSGNIINNNVWKNYKTEFNGVADQFIKLKIGKNFETWFEDVDSTSKLIALSDITTVGSFYLGRSELDLNHHYLNMNTNRSLHNGYLKNAKLRNGILSYLTLRDSIYIFGSVEISDYVDAIANVIVEDTLTAIANGGGTAVYYFKLYGDIENRGFIGSIYDDLLVMRIRGNIINRGNWNTYYNDLLLYQNPNQFLIKCFNTGTNNMFFNGSVISGGGAASFNIISGGGVQNIAPNQSYDLTIQFSPASSDTTAVLSINSGEIGSLSTIYLVGHNYNSVVDADENEHIISPDDFALYQNYPNPFNPSTTIQYQVSSIAHATLKVYDVLGKEVTTLVNEVKSPGVYYVQFTINNLSSGIYYYQLKSGSFIQTKKMILLK